MPVHDFGELPDGRLFYAMKRVRGDRLDRWMAAGRDLTERLGVFLRVCERWRSRTRKGSSIAI